MEKAALIFTITTWFVVASALIVAAILVYLLVETISRKYQERKQRRYRKFFNRAAGSNTRASAVKGVLAGLSYREGGNRAGVSRSSMHRIVRHTCERVNPHAFAIHGGSIEALRKNRKDFTR